MWLYDPMMITYFTMKALLKNNVISLLADMFAIFLSFSSFLHLAIKKDKG